MEKEKLISNILLLDAVRLIRKIRENPEKSSKLKRDHYAHIGVIEVFLEATPSAFLFMILIVSTTETNRGESEGLEFLLMGPLDGTFGAYEQLVLFIVSCASSIFSSAFGVARYSRFQSTVKSS